MAAALELNRIDKAFNTPRGTFRALSGVDLTVPEGVAYGLLGPNGAGKSTLLRIALGLVRPNHGHVSLFGSPASIQVIRQRVGALIEAPALYPFLTAAETLENLARASDVERLDKGALLRRAGLEGAAHRQVGTFSMGMRQRLGVACALLNRPDLVILDEPVNGLDPNGVHEMRALVRDLVERDGVTVLLSSHLLDEVERTCDHVGILHEGKVVGEGSVEDLLSRTGVIRIETTAQPGALAALGARARATRTGIELDGGKEEVPAILERLVAANIPVFDARFVRPRLEDIFLEATGKRT